MIAARSSADVAGWAIFSRTVCGAGTRKMIQLF
jgi:hypothetical protein